MRWFGWFRKPDPVPALARVAAEILKPGTCECEHSRCCHVDGRGRCTAAYPADAEWPEGAVCACKIFILDEDGGDDDTPDVPTDPAVRELERMMKS